jgi:hypothetical protein
MEYNHFMHHLLPRGLFTCLLLLLVGIPVYSPAHAQNEQRFFPETGHTVSDEFLIFYERVADPMLVYGYPITDAFQDPIYGRIVQYFQKARFELYPNESPELRVKSTSLGSLLYRPGQLRYLPRNSPGCRTFQDTEGSHQVCYAFLDFFIANGGIEQFGHPISNLESQDGRIVQYFQRARFEWHPQLPSGERVQLTDLGRIYFDQQAIDKNLLRQKDNLPQTILRLNVRAFPERAVTSLQGRQTVYVVVQDQNLLPVADVQIFLRLRLPSGEKTDLFLQAHTDEKGLARLSLPFQVDQPGELIIEVTARLDDLQGQTISSFQAWW